MSFHIAAKQMPTDSAAGDSRDTFSQHMDQESHSVARASTQGPPTKVKVLAKSKNSSEASGFFAFIQIVSKLFVGPSGFLLLLTVHPCLS